MSTIAEIVTSLGTIATGMWSMATEAMTWVTSNALASVMFLIPLVGMGIGAINRILRR